MINRDDGSVVAWNGKEDDSAESLVAELRDSGYTGEIVMLDPSEDVKDRLAKFVGLDPLKPAPAKIDLESNEVLRAKEIWKA